MPLFYFDTDDGGTYDRDDQGLDLLDASAARLRALEALPDMARDHVPNGDHRRFAVVVRDMNNATVYTAIMTLSGLWESARP